MTDAVRYRLSPMQEGMLARGLQYSGRGLDLAQIVIDFAGLVDVYAMAQAWRQVMARHAALRTAFEWRATPAPVQVVAPAAELQLEVLDWRGQGFEAQEAALAELLSSDRARGVRFDQAPLSRVTVVQRSAASSQVVWTIHHLLLDERSALVALREVCALYDAAVAGHVVQLPEPAPYRAYIDWLMSRDTTASIPFWRGLLAGVTAATPLPLDHALERRFASAHYKELTHPLAARTALGVRALAAAAGVTPNTVVQAGWALVLGTYAGTDDVVFGSVRAGRHMPVPDAASLVGMTIYTVPVRVRLQRGGSVRALLGSLREQHLAVREHEHVGLAQIQRCSDVPIGQPLFESLVVFENESLAARLKRAGDAWRTRRVRVHRQPSYPVSLAAAFEGEDAMWARLNYYDDLLTPAGAERVLRHFAAALDELAVDPDRRLRDVRLASEKERRAVRRQGGDAQGWSQTSAFAGSLPARVIAHACAVPNAVAVTCGEASLTYGELHRRASELAWQLRGLGAGPDIRVGVCLDRSALMVVALLAVSMAGAAYVPLDPALPAERRRFMLHDCGARVLVTREEFERPLYPLPPGCRVLRLDGGPVPASDVPDGWAGETPDPQHLAYVLYTSGSTGQPKGVMVTHANVTALLQAVQARFAFGPSDVWTVFHSFGFDFSVWEMWGALAHGARLVVVPYAVARDPRDFGALLEREGVTVLNQTPSAFAGLQAAFLAAEDERQRFAALRLVIFGGEALRPAALRPWFAAQGDVRPQLVNMFGITETTVHVTVRPLTCADAESASARSPIGGPLPHLEAYVLDANGELAPTGVTGELYVGGAGLARGYLGRPALTAARFVPDPFGRVGARLYRSGDLARWTDAGELEYLGRIDDQVKIRGHRIELGEIEAVLRRAETVRDAVVVVRDTPDGDRRLVAYMTPTAGSGTAPTGAGGSAAHKLGSPSWLADVREYARSVLPEYMLPAAFCILDSLPLTANGKLDRRRLPEPEEGLRTVAAGEEPVSPVELVVAAVWSEALEVGDVGRHDTFADLGGHSILATRIASRLEQLFRTRVPIRAVFEEPTVSALAAYLVASEREPGRTTRIARQIEAAARTSEPDLARGVE